MQWNHKFKLTFAINNELIAILDNVHGQLIAGLSDKKSLERIQIYG